MACIIFTAPSPREGEFFCHPSPNFLNTHSEEKFERMLDLNKTAWVQMLHPVETDADGYKQVDFCNVYADSHRMAEHYFHSLSSVTQDWVSSKRNKTEAKIVPCERFYHHSEYRSLVMDYNLVCDKDILIASTQFFHLFGVLTGGLLANYLLKQ